ncbi:MAG: PLP-dependent aminotransferase family protein [Bacteroidota bacterium]
MTTHRRPPLLEVLASGLAPEPPLGTPLYLRLHALVRGLILNEHLDAGQRLPSSRTLARDLGISRTTVELAYHELVADGFVERRRGSGTYVVDLLPRRPTRLGEGQDPRHAAPLPALSRRGQHALRAPRFRDAPGRPVGFAACLPSDDAFPFTVWNDVLRDVLLRYGRDLQQSTPLRGNPDLRRAIADHLARTRRVRCTPEQILIVGSTQQALVLVAHLLLDPGDAVWMEDPGYLGARAVFQALGAHLVPVPVDEEGLHVAVGLRSAPEARLAYVTPSHQYPTGSTLSSERRMALLAWATEAGAWIIEDDYDSEFRHVGRPLAPLQSADERHRVIYIGTFNKALFPGLRLAYMVLPDGLEGAMERLVETMGGQPPTLIQTTMARFMADGHFAAHLRRTRETYRARRAVLLEAAAEHLGETVTLGPSETGLHVCVTLPAGTDDLALAARAEAAGLHVPPLSPCYLTAPASPGVILGYAAVDERAIRRGVGQLAEMLSA